MNPATNMTRYIVLLSLLFVAMVGCSSDSTMNGDPGSNDTARDYVILVVGASWHRTATTTTTTGVSTRSTADSVAALKQIDGDSYYVMVDESGNERYLRIDGETLYVLAGEDQNGESGRVLKAQGNDYPLLLFGLKPGETWTVGTGVDEEKGAWLMTGEFLGYNDISDTTPPYMACAQFQITTAYAGGRTELTTLWYYPTVGEVRRIVEVREGGSIIETTSTLLNTCCIPDEEARFCIAGSVTDEDGQGIEGISLSLSGGATVPSQENGGFVFAGLAGGRYTVRPSLAGYRFEPDSLVVTITNGDVSGLAITAIPDDSSAASFAIEGRITGSGNGNAGVEGVVVMASTGAVDTTDAAGHYSFEDLINGNYTITPVSDDYVFSPSSREVVIHGGDVKGVDFTCGPELATATIAGVITGPGGTPLAAVTVTLAGSVTVVTDSTGAFAFRWLPEGSYDIVPTKDGYRFSPETKNVQLNGTDVRDISFSGHADNISGDEEGSIAGCIVDTAGNGIHNVTIELAGKTYKTGNDGSYSIDRLAPGTYDILPVLEGYSFDPEHREVELAAGEHITGQDFREVSGGACSIAGRITDASGNAVKNATVRLSTGISVKTSNDGYYLFTDLLPGYYTVEPEVTATLVFTPSSRIVVVLGTAVDGQNFTAAERGKDGFTITGRIATVQGDPVAGVLVTLSTGATATTGGAGEYSFAGLSKGDYLVTPTLSGYSFTPASPAVTIFKDDAVQDFTAATGTCTISGTVTGAKNVTVTLTGDVTLEQDVDDGGTYSFTVPRGGTYTVSASRSGTTMLPISRTFEPLTSDQVQDFVAEKHTVTLSGTIIGADAVTVALTGDATETRTVDSGGAYSFVVAAEGNYTVTPSAPGVTFSPASMTYESVASDQVQDFTAEVGTCTISGAVTGAKDVTVTLTGDLALVQKVDDDGGSYSFTVPRGGTYTVTADKNNYTFQPESRTFEAIQTDQSQDFIATRK